MKLLPPTLTVFLPLLLPLLLPGSLLAQADEAWRQDPYTKADPAAMKKAGYTSFGPFTWGDDHDSRLIHKMLTHARILWIGMPQLILITQQRVIHRREIKTKQLAHD